jgi:hypothetical protein
MATITRKPGPGLKRLEAIKLLNKTNVKVGWFESSKYPNGTPVAYVAAIQNFGYAPKNIPPRMGLQSMIDKRKVEWKGVAEQSAQAVMDGEEPLRYLEAMGGLVEGQVREQIASVFEPPLKQATIEARARRTASGEITESLAKPLNDTGYMMASVTHQLNGAKENA